MQNKPLTKFVVGSSVVVTNNPNSKIGYIGLSGVVVEVKTPKLKYKNIKASALYKVHIDRRHKLGDLDREFLFFENELRAVTDSEKKFKALIKEQKSNKSTVVDLLLLLVSVPALCLLITLRFLWALITTPILFALKIVNKFFSYVLSKF